MNVFTDYTPQLSWKNHDIGLKLSLNGTKGAAHSIQIKLPGSMDVKGQPALMPIPNRDSINTETTLHRDKTDKIRRGGR